MGELHVITERSDPAVQRIIDVSKGLSPRPRTMIIEDVDPLLVALGAGVSVIEVYALDSVALSKELLSVCRKIGVPIRLVNASVLNQIFKGDRKAKVFGVARVPTPMQLTDIDALPHDIVVLDGVRISGNIGAIVRTCRALGASAVVLVDSNLTSIADRRLIRSSRAYVFSLPVILARREELLVTLRSSDRPVLLFDSTGETSVHELGRIRARATLVFGSEKRGSSEDLSALARTHGRRVVIPMDPHAESLNVSVSVGIGLSSRSQRNLM